MKGLIKIIFWVVVFALGAILIVYGTNIWNVPEKQSGEINNGIRIKGPTGPPYVKGPTGSPPNN